MANEKRLIDANALKEQCFKFNGHVPRWAMAFAQGQINCAPTVEAVEVPPIKIGDTAYFIIHGKIYKAEVYFIRWEQHRQYGIHSEISANVGMYSSVGASFNDFGKTLFLTKEEAKAALAKMDGERREEE